MNSLRRRIADAEARMEIVKPGIMSILIIGDPQRLGDSVGESSPSGIRYLREPHEFVQAFRARARAEAERAGEKMVFFHEHEFPPSDGEPDVADLITITDPPT